MIFHGNYRRLVRPRWLYGSEGELSLLRWVGRLEDMSIEEMEALSEDNPYWGELIPEYGDYLWALPKTAYGGNKTWQRCEIPYWEAFR